MIEMALTVVALVGAGLFFRSFQRASVIDRGFDLTNISVSQFYLSNSGYSAAEQRQFCRLLRQRLEAAPGVLGVTYSDVVPLGSVVPSSPWHQLEIEGYAPSPNEQLLVHRATVPPGYFDLMRIPVLDGRDFTERDDSDAPMVIIVNQTFARRFFSGVNPVGRAVRMGGDSMVVVGMVRDSKYHSPMEAPLPFFYVPFQQLFAPGLNFSVFVKAEGDPRLLTPTLRREALALNEDATFHTILLADAVTAPLYSQKVAASLLTVVGVTSLLLAAVGLYSVMSYAVSQRTQELGVRMALGAEPGDVLALIVRDGLKLTVPGLLAGLAAALAVSRVVGGMLVGVSTADPMTFTTTACFLGMVALLACYFPARRAARVDPLRALRSE
jgi:predicted permease